MLKTSVFSPSTHLMLSCKKYVNEGCSFVLGTCFFFAGSTIFLTAENINKAFVFNKQSRSDYIQINRVFEEALRLTEEKVTHSPYSEIITIYKYGDLKYVRNPQTNHTTPREEAGSHVLFLIFRN